MTPLAEPISTLIDGGEIASRVERLLRMPHPPHEAGRPSRGPLLPSGAP
jgi:hypothetical protein